MHASAGHGVELVLSASEVRDVLSAVWRTFDRGQKHPRRASDGLGMWVVEATEDARVSDQAGRLAYSLRRGERYAVYDSEAQAGISGKALRAVGRLDDVLPPYRGQLLSRERLLVPFIGGLGDAITLASCLGDLKRRHPEVTLDVPHLPLHHELFDLLEVNWIPRPYPILAADLGRHSYHMCLEEIDHHGADPNIGNAEVFARCMGIAPPAAPATLSLPRALLCEWHIGPSSGARIGIAIARQSSMKSYPVDLVLELARELLRTGATVWLLGVGSEINHELPHAPPILHNMVDQTPTVGSLAAVVSQLDAVVCCDSFHLHLAGALRVPTVGVFTSCSSRSARGYPTIRPVTSGAACSPCGRWDDKCPQGHASCFAARHSALSPRRLCDHVLNALRAAATVST